MINEEYGFWEKFYIEFLNMEIDDEYHMWFGLLNKMFVIADEWWFEDKKGVYPIVLQYALIPLLEEDEPIMRE